MIFKKFTNSFRKDSPKDWFAYALYPTIKKQSISTGFIFVTTYILEEFKVLAGGANNEEEQRENDAIDLIAEDIALLVNPCHFNEAAFK